MRHRHHGRQLGRSPTHLTAMKRNMAASLFLTERDAEFDDNKPKVPGRIITTLEKAKELRPMVEKCITIARHGLLAQAAAAEFGTTAERQSAAWKAWRQSPQWNKWAAAMAPAVKARRRTLVMLGGDKTAVRILFEKIAPRFMDRPGGYTRIMRLAKPRLGDNGTRAILELVGVRDRISARPAAAPSVEPEVGGPAPAAT